MNRMGWGLDLHSSFNSAKKGDLVCLGASDRHALAPHLVDDRRHGVEVQQVDHHVGHVRSVLLGLWCWRRPPRGDAAQARRVSDADGFPERRLVPGVDTLEPVRVVVAVELDPRVGPPRAAAG